LSAFRSVDPPSGLHSSQDAIDEARDAKLRRDESLNRRDFADVHPENARPIGQGGDQTQGVIPAETSGFRRPERGNQRGVEPVAIKCEIDGSPTGLDHIWNPARGSSFIWT